MPAAAMPMEQQFVSVSQAAVALGWSRAKTYYCARQGDLPFVKIGGFRFIPIEALREVLAAQEKSAKTLAMNKRLSAPAFQNLARR